MILGKLYRNNIWIYARDITNSKQILLPKNAILLCLRSYRAFDKKGTGSHSFLYESKVVKVFLINSDIDRLFGQI